MSCQKLYVSLLYFNKSLLHKNSERSSLFSGPGLNSSPLEAKNPGIFHGSATTFQIVPLLTHKDILTDMGAWTQYPLPFCAQTLPSLAPHPES